MTVKQTERRRSAEDLEGGAKPQQTKKERAKARNGERQAANSERAVKHAANAVTIPIRDPLVREDRRMERRANRRRRARMKWLPMDCVSVAQRQHQKRADYKRRKNARKRSGHHTTIGMTA